MNTGIIKPGILIFFISIFFTSCSLSTAGDSEKQREKDGVPRIDQLLGEASDRIDQEVSVTGKVSRVCESSGRSIFITDGEQYLRINKSEDISKFDAELTGATVIVHGILKISPITSERLERAEANAEANPERHEARRDHCNNKLHNVHRMQEWIAASDKDYYPNYTIDGIRVNIVE